MEERTPAHPLNMTPRFILSTPKDSHRVPSAEERIDYHSGTPSPHLIARSSATPRVVPTGPKPYLVPIKCSRIGQHRLNEAWEDATSPVIDTFPPRECVEYTSLDPLRIGTADESSPPIILWIGVILGSLSAEQGLPVIPSCRSILFKRGISDIHTEIHESQVLRLARLYSPVVTSDLIDQVVEPFSTTLGIPICNSATPYFVDSRRPKKLFLLMARHFLFHPDKEPNELYRYRQGSSRPHMIGSLLNTAPFKVCIIAIDLGFGNTILPKIEQLLSSTATRLILGPQLPSTRLPIACVPAPRAQVRWSIIATGYLGSVAPSWTSI